MTNLLSTTFDCSKYANTKSQCMYVKYYIAFDVRSVHILRFQDGINEEYEDEEGSALFEHEMIEYYDLICYFEENFKVCANFRDDERVFIDFLMQKMQMKDILKAIVDYDTMQGYENYDCRSEHTTVDDLVSKYVLQESNNISNITI